ncbi:hypothetical protein JL39_17270 [Rhizobium sp. YS-1r]|nr:hypothetical protein JL39_17270 [Rhizobium sp. YS-1r]
MSFAGPLRAPLQRAMLNDEILPLLCIVFLAQKSRGARNDGGLLKNLTPFPPNLAFKRVEVLVPALIISSCCRDQIDKFGEKDG